MRSQTLALGLGSNLANPLENLRVALAEIKKSRCFEVLAVSAIYESEALLPQNAIAEWNKNFLNAAVLCRVLGDQSPEGLLHEVQSIEKKIGRVQAERWAPRQIDIDLLFWNGEKYISDSLEIPHKELLNRPFALMPLLEIWPQLKWQLQLPDWTYYRNVDVPFKTKKSGKYFWPRMVGILNVTKNSFSDGGLYLDAESLNERVARLIEQGADIIDIGAESTRPGATIISAQDEFKNLDWALSEIKSNCSISLDCRHAPVVERILQKHKIDFLNDVGGFTDSDMRALLNRSKLFGFAMHSLTIPPDAGRVLNPEINPCKQLVEWWLWYRLSLLEAGIAENKVIFDPGIGFGKTKLQNLFIVQNLEQFSKIEDAIMIGHSRKSFLTLLSDQPAEKRDPETAAVTRQLNLAYVQYLRVHDIQTQVAALR